ncbi:MAG: hypothetical protein PHW08_07160 [Kiritimatiellae bacterium]|nr:hypothetical protein [Kiritimatiellia bacterium]
MDMKTLVQAIQTALKNSATLSYVSDTDIFIVPDEDIVPVTCTLPAIGIKDGPIARDMEATASGSKLNWDMRWQVHVLLYVEMTAGETPVVGQTSPTAIKGILDIANDVNTILSENYLSVSGIIDAYCVAESESELIGYPDLQILKKRLTFEYMTLPDI